MKNTIEIYINNYFKNEELIQEIIRYFKIYLNVPDYAVVRNKIKGRDVVLKLKIDKKEYHIIVVAGDKKGRNTFISQPMINICNIPNKNIFVYFQETTEIINAKRIFFDIKCIKTFGIDIVGNTILNTKNGKINISDILPFRNFEEFQNEFDLLQSESEKKDNDITTIEYDSDILTINNGKTDGANKGSLLMLILGSYKLVDRIKLLTRESHDFGKNFIDFLPKLKVDFNVRSEEIKKLQNTFRKKEGITEYTFKRNSYMQSEFKKNILNRTNLHCELTGNEYSDFKIINSHIFRCEHISNLVINKKIDEEFATKLIVSGNNGLKLKTDYDDLFDKGKITFDDGGNIILSEKIKNKDVFKNLNKLLLNDQMKILLNIHRKYIFIDSEHRCNAKDFSKNISDKDLESLSKINN